MTFSSILPLVLLIGVPVIIILYLLRPKGTKKVVPSLMLWRRTDSDERSVTFSKRFIRNILMYLEILALLLLMLAAMTPLIKHGITDAGESVAIVIDTSGSMQFDSGDGQTRFDKAVSAAISYVESSSGDVSVVACSNDVEILITGSRDRKKCGRVLRNLKCTDDRGDIAQAEGIIDSLKADNVIILTDAEGAEGAADIAPRLNAQVSVFGDEMENVGISYVSLKKKDGGKADIAIGYYAVIRSTAQFDISLYDGKDNLIDVRTVKMTEDQQSKSGIILMVDKTISGGTVRAEITGVSFGDGSQKGDGLARDNTGYGILADAVSKETYLIGAGNTYVEKAYMAATGESILKAQSDSQVPETAVAFYDEADLATKNISRFIFEKKSSDELSGSVVTVRAGELMTDMSDFTFGVSKLYALECPEWAEPFIVANDGTEDEKIVAYFGEHDGIREIVFGFDIRDSELPLMAEFPILMADSITYLSDESLVPVKYINAGEMPVLSTSVSSEVKISFERGGDIETMSSGLYSVSDTKSGKEVKEFFVSRFPQAEGNGLGTFETTEYVSSAKANFGFYSLRKLCLVLALIVILLDLVIYLRRNGFRKKLPLAVRGVLILLILLSIFEFSLPSLKRKTTTVFVVDRSKSMEGSFAAEEEYLKTSVEALPRGENYAVVTFGSNNMVEQFVTNKAEYFGIYTVPESGGTDIESAVRLAASLIPDNSKGRIVVVSDGRETIGDIAGTLSLLKEEEIELCAKMIDSSSGNDVYIQEISMPETLYSGDAYSLQVTVFSSYSTSAVIKVWSGSQVLKEMNVNLTTGENTFVVDEVAGDKAIEEKTVTIEADGDEVEENNSAVGAAVVELPRSVLLISGLSEDSSGLQEMLESLNINLSVVSALNAPSTLVDMLAYKTIIIDNCYVGDLPEGFVNSLESYVRDYGGGIVTTGGKESYAPGGYKDTPLEKVLPVDMTPKGIDEAPSLAMVMVIDNSGSMGAEYDMNGNVINGKSKIDIAVEAAQLAVDNLNRTDYVGVLTFSDQFVWRQQIVQVDDREGIKATIEGIGIEGGTVIKPAVKEAAESLKNVDAGIKHIILLTDGEGETKDFSDAIELINDNGITMSTIAVGADSDTSLLETLADECDGRYYYSDSSTEVPKIFAEEVYLSASTYYKNGDFAVAMNNSGDITKGLFSSGIPNISGYIATSTKTGARELMTTSEDDPLLSCWQYGLGKTVSFMSSGSSTWDEALASSQDYPELWKRMVDYASTDYEAGGDKLSVYKRRDTIDVNYSAGEYSEDTEIVGVINTPSGKTEELVVSAGEPGEYKAQYIPTEMGIYSVAVKHLEKGEVTSVQTAIVTRQFSSEYRSDISNESFKVFVTQNGRILEDDSKIYTKLKAKNITGRDITDILIIIAAIMLIIDIVVRRFDIPALLKLGAGKAAGSKKEKKAKNGKPVSAGTEPIGAGGTAAGNAGTVQPAAGTVQSVAGSTGTVQGTQPFAGFGSGSNVNPTGVKLDKAALKEQKKLDKAAAKAAKAAKKAGGAADQQAQSGSGGLDTLALLQKKKDREKFER